MSEPKTSIPTTVQTTPPNAQHRAASRSAPRKGPQGHREVHRFEGLQAKPGAPHRRASANRGRGASVATRVANVTATRGARQDPLGQEVEEDAILDAQLGETPNHI